jgi:hypothetical protein
VSNPEGNKGRGAASELADGMRKEGIGQASKMLVTLAVGLVALAGSGWWLALKGPMAQQLGGVPSGAVMAFDLSPPNPCPIGWTVFKEATARVLIGAGQPADFYEEKYGYGSDRAPLAPKAYREHGGAENHILSADEGFVHSVVEIGDPRPNEPGFVLSSSENGRKQIALGKERGGREFPIIPPYVALYFCEKD